MVCKFFNYEKGTCSVLRRKVSDLVYEIYCNGDQPCEYFDRKNKQEDLLNHYFEILANFFE